MLMDIYFMVIEDFEEIIPRELNTEKEKQSRECRLIFLSVGVLRDFTRPFNFLWVFVTLTDHTLRIPELCSLTIFYLQPP
jgi:hypothetical protein